MSRLTIITTSEKATQKSITRPRFSVHHLLLGIVPRIRAPHDPPQTGFERSRLALMGDARLLPPDFFRFLPAAFYA
jgi:hypothetical protein